MSGGSMDYFYEKAEYAAESFKLSSPLRKAFRRHLLLVSKCCKAIEWNDSGDGDDEEEELLRNCLGKKEPIETLISEAEELIILLNIEIKKAKEDING